MDFSNTFRVIHTFTSVTFNEQCKPLVICDIDFTFIRPSEKIEYFENLSRELHESGKTLMTMSYNMGMIKQTDPSGFMQMLETIHSRNGKLIFLTARKSQSHQRTIRDLAKVGLPNPEQFEIHYTNNEMTKGEYIKNMNITDGYDHISFIDDYISYISSVHYYFPSIYCYLFQFMD